MSAHEEKSRLTVECTLEEKTYIKMLATKAHMTISEFLLSYVRPNLPISGKKSNKETLKTMKEAKKGKGASCESLDDFWKQMGVKPRRVKT
mgnify:CR=1 FL=1